jgi:hypothetical protein
MLRLVDEPGILPVLRGILRLEGPALDRRKASLFDADVLTV